MPLLGLRRARADLSSPKQGASPQMSDRRAHAVIDLAALQHNFGRVQRLSGGRDVIAVIKADAYGHGAVPVAHRLAAAGCRRVAVVSVEEAAELREAGVTGEILVLGGITASREAQTIAEYDLSPVIHHLRDLSLAREAGQSASMPIGVEIEVDTGMQRMGVAYEEALLLAEAIEADPLLKLEGVFTHFAHADDPEPEASLRQIEIFRSLIHELRAAGIEPRSIHAANSSALHVGRPLLDALPEATAVRPGLMLYGATIAPHEDPEKGFRPVMSVRTRVAAIRDIPAGAGVGYGGVWRAPHDTRVATLPIGYADGVPRTLSNRGQVWVADGPRSMVGRVSMDYLSVEIGDSPIEVGDPATYFGPPSEGTGGISVEEQAEAAGTLAYELLVNVGSRVPREPLDED